MQPNFLVLSGKGRGNALFHKRDYDGAVQSYERSLALNPDIPQTALLLTHLLQLSARWDRLPALWATDLQSVRQGRNTGGPMPLLSHPHITGGDLRQAGALHCASLSTGIAPRPFGPPTKGAGCRFMPTHTSKESTHRGHPYPPSIRRRQ